MSNPAEPSLSRTLRVGVLSRLGALEPWKANDTVTTQIVEQVYEAPFWPSTGAEPPEPLLFSEPLRTGGDVRTLTARVRQGVTFSDGSPCTAQDVAASLRNVPGLDKIAEVSTREDRVVFHLDRPDPTVPPLLAQAFYGVAKKVDGRFVGTGPFLPPEAPNGGDPTRADRVVLRANRSSRKPPRMESLSFQCYPTTAALLDAVKAGEVDVTYGLTFSNLPELADRPVVAKTLEGSSTSFLVLNRERPALRDAFIRRALCLAVSRSGVARATYGPVGATFVADGILPPFLGARARLGLPGADLPAALLQLALDNLKAPPRLSLLLTWAPKTYLPDPGAAAKVIVENLALLGTTVDVVTPRDREDYRSRQASGDYDLLLGGWVADTPIAADFLDSLLGSGMIPSETSSSAANNLSRWADPATDRMVSSIRVVPTVEGIGALYRRVEQHGLLVPLLHGKLVAVYRRDLRGFHPSPLARSSFGEVEVADRE
jgi:ABC-type transport system substrate-binding protein